MNKKMMSLSLVLAAALSVNGIAPVRAENDPEPTDGTKKEETVYAFLDAEGGLKSATVSEWLHNDQGLTNVRDESILENIRNIKSDTEPVIDGRSVLWNTADHDLYYQGNTAAALPVTMKVTYKLDGREVHPQDIAGQSGSLEIRIQITNHLESVETISGKTKMISTLMPYAVITDLPTDIFSDVKTEDGILINESKNQMIAFASISGLSETMKSMDTDLLDKIRDKIKDEFVIQAQVKNFEMPSIIMAVTTASEWEDSDLDRSELDELTDGVDDLKSATAELLDGSVRLYDANVEMNDKMGEFQSKYKEFSDGLNTAAASSVELKDGASKLSESAGLMKSQLEAMLSKAHLSDDQLQGLLQKIKASLDELQKASVLMESLGQTLQGLSSMPSAVSQGIKAQASDDMIAAILSQVQTAVSDQVMAGIDAQEINVPLNLDVDALKTSIHQAVKQSLIDSGADEAAAEGTAGALADQVGAQLSNALNGAAEPVKAEVREAMKASAGTGIAAMSSGAAAADRQMIDTIADQTEKTLQSQIDAMSATMQQANQLLQNMTGMLADIDAMIDQLGGYEGLKQMLGGLDQLPEGLNTLRDGTEQLAAGTAVMKDGLDRLNSASGDITDAIRQFKDATQELTDKTGELNDGVDRFSREGIDELSSRVSEAVNDLNDAMDTAKAALDQAQEYHSYAGAPESMKTTVKFVMKTDEVKIPEIKESPTADKKEVKTSFWDRVKNLFH